MKIKRFFSNLIFYFFCIFVVVMLSYTVIAASTPNISFTENTVLDLTGQESSFWILADSWADSVDFYSSYANIDLVDGYNFYLGTGSISSLSVLPDSGNLTLTVTSTDISSGYIDSWMLTGSDASTGVTISVATSQANTWYKVTVDSVQVNSYQSNDSGIVSFTYTGLSSAKVFTLVQDTESPASFSLVSPVNNNSTGSRNINFSWNLSSSSDINSYDLYLDSSLSSSVASSISSANVSSISCGSHTWFVRVLDQASNYTQTDTYNFTISCSGMSISPSVPTGSIDKTSEESIFNINNNKEYTNSHEINLYFYAENVQTVAISEDSNFLNASFVDYQPIMDWELSQSEGNKTLYVRLRSMDGGILELSDSIILSSSNESKKDDNEIGCSLDVNKPYKSLYNNAVYYITNNCTKRAFMRSDVFFTYFDSWDDVIVVSQGKLNLISNDKLGFIPWGPQYDPKYGALVKIVDDPKVYLLLGDNKYWITSEDVFGGLGYEWYWIEDVDSRLLDKYNIGTEITYTDHHPNYTLVKYKNSPKIYRLEPNPDNSGQQLKRWIVDEKTFLSLNFRWDRIVTITPDEVYKSGDNLI